MGVLANKLVLVITLSLIVLIFHQLSIYKKHCFSQESCQNYQLEMALQARSFVEKFSKMDKDEVYKTEELFMNNQIYPVDETWITYPNFYDIALKEAIGWKHEYKFKEGTKRKKLKIMFFDKFFWVYTTPYQEIYVFY